MTFSRPIIALTGALALAACAAPPPTATPAPAAATTPPPVVTGGDLTGAPARACRAAIAQETGRQIGDVAVFDVAESEAGVMVDATVAGAEAPWRCVTDRDGKRIAGVTYTGSEGRL